jgi:hypothetical protein
MGAKVSLFQAKNILQKMFSSWKGIQSHIINTDTESQRVLNA